ncbi:MAG: DUF2339 domain-containing protein [Acidobacteria bacterium]|uniref:DUF2339 domain-containing protein n=1 Tax=Candidatus Polarisedimenticola svalbardensis TaxID=2886004 RepID=A0A8J6XYU4_9BACT|nr:DUF2339 domain-containing protein [Candidatus Polarisedimenticola svalbardensis]
MEFMIVVLLALILVIPVTALILAIFNNARAGRIEQRLNRLEMEAAGRKSRPEPTLPLPLPVEEEPPATLPPSHRPPPPPVPSPSPVEPVAPVRKPIWTREDVMAKLPVWLGALAMALSGAFLVKYSFDRGWLGPTARVLTGLGFGVAMMVVGDRAFRKTRLVGHGLVAAGVAVVYAALLAAVNFYDLLSPMAGFGLMALNTAAAVAMSVRHGRIVVVIGMIGGFMTPMWIGSQTREPGLLFMYLFLLQVGLLVVGQRRRWWPVSLVTLAFSLFWAGFWIVTSPDLTLDRIPASLFLLASAVSFVRAGWGTRHKDLKHASAWIGLAGAAGSMLLLAILVGSTRFDMIEWGFFGILAVGAVVLSWREPAYRGLAVLAAAVAALLLASWGATVGRDEIGRLVAVAVTAGLFFTLSGFAAMRDARPTWFWAALSSGSTLAIVAASVPGLTRVFPDMKWWPVCLAAALLPAAFAFLVHRGRDRLEHSGYCLAAFVVSASALLTLAIGLDLERAFLTSALAVEIPVLAWLAFRFRIPFLERGGLVLAMAVAVRLLLNPQVLYYPLGEGLLFNWLLYGYGLPIIAFLAAAVLFRRGGQDNIGDLLESGACLFGWAYTILEIRHLFHPGNFRSQSMTVAEMSTYVVAWIAYALLLRLVHQRTGRRQFELGTTILGASACGLAVLYLAGVLNPLWERYAVGETAVFNKLLLIYGIPLLLAVILAGRYRVDGRKILARFVSGTAVLLGFTLLSLEIRQLFHGTYLQGGSASGAELYSYSVAWILFAVGLLVLWRYRGGMVLKYGSAIFMALAVGKVFLYDTANLVDLYRVLSLFGLGLTLLGLSWFYQRFVFGVRSGKE